MAGIEEVRPQPGPQERFLSTPADIAIIGGGNDGGKTFALLMDASRHLNNSEFGAVYFRRLTTHITNEGGLWDEACRMFRFATNRVTSPRHVLTFATGSSISFAHLQHDHDRFDYDGAQIPGIYFDQLEQFTEGQFWHLMGRNRSGCGVRPYIRASFNPPGSPNHWLSKLIQWYWDVETGYIIPERSGVVRWFKRTDEGDVQWFDEDPHDSLAKSFTCILALIDDNKIALKSDPQRLANLMNLPYVERERRRYGNMKIEDVTGDGLFDPAWWQILSFEQWDAILRNPLTDFKWARGWDPAGGKSKTADYSCGVLVGYGSGRLIIADVVRGQWSPHARNKMMAATARADARFEAPQYYWKSRTPDMNVSIEDGTEHLPFFAVKETGSKFYRAQGLAADAERGVVWLAPGEWNASFMREGSEFVDEDSDEKRKDDQIDSASLARSQVIP